MAQDTLVKLLLENKREIARETALAILQEKIPNYADLGLTELIKRFTVGVEQISQHLIDGDVAEYRKQVVKIAEERRKQGFLPQNANRANLLFANKMKEMVERKLAAPGNETARVDYLRRLDVLLNLDRVTGVTRLMKKD